MEISFSFIFYELTKNKFLLWQFSSKLVFVFSLPTPVKTIKKKKPYYLRNAN